MQILIVDDHVLFRDGLAMLVEQHFPGVVLREASTLSAALLQLGVPPRVELILLDLGLGDSDGVDTIARLRVAEPELPVVVMSADDRPETVVRSISAGASGFIPKTARPGVIEQGLRTVFEGGVFLPRSIFRNPPGGTAYPRLSAGSRGLAGEPAGLTQRQIEVLRMLAAGHPSKVIARRIGVAESTVKTHLVGIFRRLSVTTRTEAVLAAARLGLLQQDDAVAASRPPSSW
jgi:DNA-binding NarL/FixJ family response regulator